MSRRCLRDLFLCAQWPSMTWHFLFPPEWDVILNLQVQLKNVLVSMEAKRTDFDHIRQDVNKVKKYASDFQTFIVYVHNGRR
jgi:hypothetical protein